MKILTKTFLGLLLYTSLTACNNNRQTVVAKVPEQKQEVKIDTTNAVKIGGFWAVPRKNFDVNSIATGDHDTLALVTCSSFVYSPFGHLKSKEGLKMSNLKNFNSVSRTEHQVNGDFEFQLLTLKSSRLILWFDNSRNAGPYSYVYKGEIKDPEVNFIDGIRIGMTTKNFMKTFFESFPVQLLSKYRYIVLESCVEDITHTYTFENDKLKSVDFRPINSSWKVDY